VVERKKLLEGVKRVVIKVGTNVLTGEKGRLDEAKIEELARQVKEVHLKGLDVAIVTSGAIGAGVAELGLSERPKEIPLEQAAASVGQCHLIRVYDENFRKYGMLISQILLTQADLRDRQRYLNARNTIFTLFQYRVVPVINENDTVAVDELQFGPRFGDNDILSALVANLIMADLLLILTDTGGLYTADPKKQERCELIRVVEDITPQILEIAKASCGPLSRGGMASKVNAARIAASYGAMVIIADGKHEADVVKRIFAGEELGTIFLPKKDKLSSRQHWIAFTLQPRGSIIIDAGAKDAIIDGKKSLLPSGVLQVVGSFEAGDCVSILDEDGFELARGLVKYSSEEIDKIKGCRSDQIEDMLGYKFADEVVHRDDLVVL